jgi:hypothetical protein
MSLWPPCREDQAKLDVRSGASPKRAVRRPDEKRRLGERAFSTSRRRAVRRAGPDALPDRRAGKRQASFDLDQAQRATYEAGLLGARFSGHDKRATAGGPSSWQSEAGASGSTIEALAFGPERASRPGGAAVSRGCTFGAATGAHPLARFPRVPCFVMRAARPTRGWPPSGLTGAHASRPAMGCLTRDQKERSPDARATRWNR